MLRITIPGLRGNHTAKIEYHPGPEYADYTAQQHRLEVIETELKKITTTCAAWRKIEYVKRNDARVEELYEAWERRDLARVGRLTRLIAGGRYGPRKRDYWTMVTANPTKQEWIDFWSQPGGLGGMGGTEQEIVAIEQIPHTTEEMDYYENDLEKMVDQDIEGIQRKLKKARLRRAAPQTAAPSELLRVLLCPVDEPKQRQQGLGARGPPAEPEGFRELFRAALAAIRINNQTPVRWHSSSATVVTKNNKIGPAGKRIYHIMGPIGKAYYSSCLARQQTRNHMDQDYGFIRGRRREGAILAMAVTEYRARKAGFNYVTAMKDMSNAFASCAWTTMDEANSKIMPEDSRDLGQQRYRRATFTIPCRDQEAGVCVKPHCGGLIGDPYMVSNFVASFSPCILTWTKDCNQ